MPLDGSATSQRGLKHAIAPARSSGARLRLVHVVDETSTIGMMEGGVDITPLAQQLLRSGRELLERGRRLAGKAGVPADTAIHESLGTHGRRGLRQVVLGSESERVVHRSPVPVLLLRASE